MNGRRNSMCSVKSWKDFLLRRLSLLRRLPSTRLPRIHSSVLVPSDRTVAASGGFIPSVGLFRTTWLSANASPSPVLPVNFEPRTSPVQPLPSTVVLPSVVLPDALIFVLPSQPEPGRPPGRNSTVNLPSPSAMTWAASLPLPLISPTYSP